MIRKAVTTDLNALFEVYQGIVIDKDKLSDFAYQTKIQNEGFLLGLESKEDMATLIEESYTFLVSENGNEIDGFLIADHRDKYRDDEYKSWFDEEAKEKYYNDPASMTVATIGVTKDKSKKGIASSLLLELEELLKADSYKYLYTIITIAPFTNCPSILFHTKHGFRRIAMGNPRQLFDFENYSAILLYKNLEE